MMNYQRQRNRPGTAWTRLRTDRRGIALPMMAILFAVLLAFMGLVLDGGRIYFEKRHMQAAADAGALGGAHEVLRGNTGLIVQSAHDSTVLNGYADGLSNVDVQVNYPPTSGPHQDPNYVEVIISRPVPTYFMPILNIDEATIRARAVAGAIHDESPSCVIALSEDAGVSPTFTLNGGAALVAPNCEVAVNSHEPGSLKINGGSSEPWCIDSASVAVASPVAEAEDYGYSGSVDCIKNGPWGSAETEPDPYAWLPEPVPGTPVPGGPWNISSTPATPLTPGYYEGGVKITGDAIVTLSRGLYIVDGLEVSGNASLRVATDAGGDPIEGVTIFNTGQGLKNISITGGGVHILRAPTAAEITANLSAYQDANGYACCEGLLFYNTDTVVQKNPNDAKIAGSASSVFIGGFYFPTVLLDYAGTSATSEWVRLVAYMIRLSGTTNVGGSAPPGGSFGEQIAALVE